MKIYKEPAILMVAGIIAIAVIVFAITKPPTNTNATVDNVVPLPLQIGNKTVEKPVSDAPSTTSSTNNSQNSQSSVKLPDIGSINSKSSSSTLNQNPLGGK